MHNNEQIIQEVDDVILESEYGVINDLFDAYDKAYTIIENYEGEDLESFSVFQETSIIQEASWSETKKKKIDRMNPNFVEDKPKLKLRQIDKKTGKKESILKSFMKLIPRLVKHVQDLHRRKMEIKKLKLVTKQAVKIGADVSRMTPGEVELFYTLMNRNVSPEELKKILRKENWHHDFKKWLIGKGLKLGGGAIVIGGTAYYLSTKKELIEKKVSDYKGEIIKKFDEEVLDGIREAGNKAAETISNAADKAAEKIMAAAKACQEAMKKAVAFIKKLYDAISKFFNIHLLRYEQTAEEGVLCRIDVKTGTLHVTMDLDMWNEWIEMAKAFVVQSAGLIGRKFEKGELKENINDDGKRVRTGAIVDYQKEKEKSNIIGKAIHPDAKAAVEKFTVGIERIAQDKTTHKNTYQPIEEFSKKAEALAGKLDKMCAAAKKLSDVYEARMNNTESRDDKWVDTEKLITEKLRGILDTQIHITNSISAVNEYIDTVANMSDSLGVGEIADNDNQQTEKSVDKEDE